MELDGTVDVEDREEIRDNNQFETEIAIFADEDRDGFGDGDKHIYGVLDDGPDGAFDTADGDYVELAAGTYEEDGLATGDAGVVTTAPDAGVDDVVLTTDEASTILTVDNGDEVIGLTFSSDDESATADVALSDGELRDSVLIGSGEEDTDRLGVTMDDANDVVADTEISGYATGVQIDDPNGVEIVRNTIENNVEGIEVVADAENALIHFNNLADNEEAGLVNAEDGDEAPSALANWWGDDAGPVVDEDDGDIAGDEADAVELIRPWLSEPVEDATSDIGDDQLFVLTDSSSPPADADASSADAEGALLIVAVPGEDDAGEIDAAGDIDMVVQEDPGDSLDNLNELAGDGTAASPFLIPDEGVTFNEQSVAPSQDTPGDYVLRAIGSDNANSPLATQTYTEPVADVEVIADPQDLPADGETESDITLQLVDDDGNAVERSGVTTRFTAPSSERESAGFDVTSEDGFGDDIDTDANGQSTITVTADTADQSVTVTGTDRDNNNADDVTITTVEPAEANFTLELVDGPTQIVQNESYEATVNVTNEGDGGKPTTLIAPLEINRETPAAHRPFVQTGNSANAIVPNRVYSYTRLDTGEHR